MSWFGVEQAGIAATMVGLGLVAFLAASIVGAACSVCAVGGRGGPEWFEIFFRGYAGIVFVSWYAFVAGVPVKSSVLIVLGVSFAVIGLASRGRFDRVFSGAPHAALALLALLIVFFYAGAMAADHANVFTLGNHDVYNYANHAIIVLADRPGAANTFVGTDLVDAIHRDAFGATIWLALLAVLSNRPPIEVTVAAMIIPWALFGAILHHLLRRVLEIPWQASLAISAFCITSPAFVFISGHYFLSHILFLSTTLAMFLSTLQLSSDGRLTFWNVITHSFPYYFLILMTYPALFLTNTAMHVVLLLSLRVGCEPAYALPPFRSIAAAALLPVLALLPILFVAVPQRVLEAVEFVRAASVSRGAEGALIKFVCVLGWPTSLSHLFSGSSADNWAVLGFASVISIGVMLLLVSRRQCFERALVQMVSLLVLSLVGAAMFCLVCVLYGPSYQQWKFACYYPLMLSFVPVTALLMVLRGLCQRLFPAAVGLLAIASGGVVLINMRNGQEVAFGTPPDRGIRALHAVDELAGVRAVLLDEFSFGEVMLIRQYITTKPLQPSSPSYYRWEAIAPDAISPATPLLSRRRCYADRPGTVALGGGLFLAPKFAALAPGAGVKFDTDDGVCGVAVEGLSGVERNVGRWTDGERVRFGITLSAPPTEALLLTLRVSPFLAPGLPAQRVDVLVNGAPAYHHRFDRGGDVDWVIPLAASVVQGQQRFSVELVLPDARPVAEVAPPSRDGRRLGLFITEMRIDSASGESGIVR